MVSATSTRTSEGDVSFATPRARSTFDDVLKEARTAFEKVNEKSYQGPLLAEPEPAQDQARRDLLGVAGRMRGDGRQVVDLAQSQQGAGQQVTQRAQELQGSGGPILDLARDTASGEYLDVRNRPEFQANIEAAIDPAREQLVQEILPQAQSQAIQAGAYGGDRDQLNRRVALEDFSEQSSQIASRIAADAYEQERARQQQAGQLMGQGVGIEQSVSDLARRGVALENDVANLIQQGRQMQTQGPTLAERIGARQRADQQARYNAQQRRFQMEQQAPFIGLPQYAQIATGTPTTSSQTVQRTPSQSQQVGNYIQAGLGALGTASQVEDETGWISDAAGAIGSFF